MSEVFTALRTETDAEEVDRVMGTYREIAQRRELVLRLLRNLDFKELILKYYLVEEAARYGQMAGQLGLKPEDRDGFMDMARATGHLKRFLQVVEQQGEHAVGQLAQYTQDYASLVRGEE